MTKKEVTGVMRKRMRELHALGVPILKIAREFGLNKETVYRHLDPRWEKKIKEYQRKRYERERQNPEIVERRRETARKYAAKKREEYKASGVRVERLPRKVTEPLDVDKFVEELLVTDKVILDTLGAE